MPATRPGDWRGRATFAALMALGWLVVDLALGPDRSLLEHVGTAVAFGVVSLLVRPFLVRKAERRDTEP